MSDALNVDEATGEVVETLTEAEAVEYAKIERVFKRYTPRRKELNEKIKRVFNSKGRRVVGPVIVSVSERASKDVNSAEKKYPFEKYPELYEVAPVFQFDRLSARQRAPFVGTTLALSVDVLAEDSPES